MAAPLGSGAGRDAEGIGDVGAPSSSIYNPPAKPHGKRRPACEHAGAISRRISLRKAAGMLLAAVAFLAGAARARAQAPFVTDDTGVTDWRRWHFEYANQFNVLPRDAYPNLRQDTNNFTIQYGLLPDLEGDLDFPLIYIQNARHSGTPSVFGLGDVDFALKWSPLPEGKGPGLAGSFAIEIPTGNVKKQLGSGLTDYVLNLIAQKTLAPATVLHVNAGVQFAGNTQTGVVGIPTPGRIYSAGMSVARDVSSRLHLGIDLNGAEIFDGGPRERQLQLTAGGNWGLTKSNSNTLDFAAFIGWNRAPRFGMSLGVSLTP